MAGWGEQVTAQDRQRDYLDFDVQIVRTSDGQYRVDAGFDDATATGVSEPIPEQSELASRIADLEDVRSLNAETTRSLATRGRRQAVPTENPRPEDVGTGLFNTLMCVQDGTSAVLGLYRNAQFTARREGKRLRLRLQLQSPDLAVLPWEYLYDPADPGRYVALALDSPFSRRPEKGTTSKPHEAKGKLKILAMIAHPREVSQLDVEGEKSAMDDIFNSQTGPSEVDLVWLDSLERSGSGQTEADLRAAMNDSSSEWNVFHFIGHGGFDEEKGEGFLVLADEEGQKPVRLMASQLSNYLSAQNPHLRLVVLNSCEGARASVKAKFSSVASHLVERGIPAVISMQHEITDRAAKTFSRALYEEVANGVGPSNLLQIDRAMSSVRNAMVSTDEWATPVLYASTEDGSLFVRQWSQDLNVKGVEAPPPPSEVRKGRTSDAGLEEGQLQKVHARVREWVEGELDKSYLAAALEELDIKSAAEYLDRPEGSEVATDQRPYDIWAEAEGQLLILGEAGTGKTRWMLRLVKQLLEEWEEDPSSTIPVPIKVSTWSGGSDFTAFLANRMFKQYKTAPKHARALIEDGKLTFAIDGLDEIEDLALRRSCVEAMNAFAQTQAGWGMIATCRFAEYAEMAPTKLQLGGAVRLQKLMRKSLLEALDHAGPALSGVRKLVSEDDSWDAIAKTPALLAMLVTAFEGVREEDMSAEELGSVDASLRKMMNEFITKGWEQAA